MKKVILITPSLNMGGAEIMCENLAVSLSELDTKVIVISLFSDKTIISNRLESKNIEIKFLDKKRGLDISMVKKLKNIFAEEKPDAVHSHNNAIQYVVPAAVLSGVKKRVHTVHSIAEKELIKPVRKVVKLFYKKCHVVPVALSKLVQDTVVKEYHLPAKNIPVIYNGINLSNCIPKSDYSIKEKFTILHIGRFEEVKNHKTLVKAFSKFHHMYPNSELKLIGDGTERENMENLVHQLKIKDNVKFLGLQSNVYGYLHDADAFTLPSIYEGIPMTLIEAMGTGLPIVASNVGGIPNMLENEKSALLIEPSEDELFTAFERLYLNESLRKTIGINAKNRSIAFSSKEMAEKYKEIYEKVDRLNH